jgi:hypothetical protein
LKDEISNKTRKICYHQINNEYTRMNQFRNCIKTLRHADTISNEPKSFVMLSEDSQEVIEVYIDIITLIMTILLLPDEHVYPYNHYGRNDRSNSLHGVL